jgi:hypothetical protein
VGCLGLEPRWQLLLLRLAGSPPGRATRWLFYPGPAATSLDVHIESHGDAYDQRRSAGRGISEPDSSGSSSGAASSAQLRVGVSAGALVRLPGSHPDHPCGRQAPHLDIACGRSASSGSRVGPAFTGRCWVRPGSKRRGPRPGQLPRRPVRQHRRGPQAHPGNRVASPNLLTSRTPIDRPAPRRREAGLPRQPGTAATTMVPSTTTGGPRPAQPERLPRASHPRDGS